MADLGNHQGDATPKGNDEVQDVNNNAAEAAASNLSAEAFTRPTEVSANTDKGTEKWDPKAFEQTAKSLTEAIAAIEAKYFKPDQSGTSIMERMKTNAPDLHREVSAQFTTQLVAPSEQTISGIRGLMKKLQA